MPAPQELIQAGFGDIIAKYVSICEWRISHVITGEYYCEQVASLIRHAVLECVKTPQAFATGILKALKSCLRAWSCLA